MIMDSPKHSVSVAAVITADDGRALLIQRADNGRWEPPGGILELGESIEDGLRREVREETGLDIEPEQLTGVYKNMPRGIIALVFRARITGGQLATTDETAAFRWATAAEVSQLASETYAVRILDGLNGRPSPAIRQHDGIRIA
jgi:8-oxo-dGTP diphosphatase